MANAQAAVQLATVVRRPAVLADGTYATQTAVEAAPLNPGMPPCAHNLRALLLVGARAGRWARANAHVFLLVCVCVCVCVCVQSLWVHVAPFTRSL